jgi:hypothetical protein
VKTKPEPGTRVRMTAEFLRNTGQYTGSEPFKVWTVQPCECGLCRSGPFVLTDEPSLLPGEAIFRHVNFYNLERSRR